MWLYLAAVVVVVWGIVARIAWQRYRERAADEDTLILRPPVQRFGKLPPADVEAIRTRAELRRQAAAQKYRASIQNTFDRS